MTDRHPHLRVVGLNPALDRLQLLDAFTVHAVNRARHVVSRAGGKSLIVARTVRRLGGDVTLYGFLGGPVGDIIAAECKELGINDRHVLVSGDTRITPIIVERGTGRSTVINEPGPTIAADELAQLEEVLFRDVQAGDHVLMTGSLPPGVPTDFYATATRAIRAADARVFLDTSGAPIASVTTVAPTVLKVNAQEFQRLAPQCDVHDEAALLAAMRDVQAAGVATVIVTRGSAGSLALDAAHAFRVLAPAVPVVNATGSGDSFFGALALALASGDELIAALQLATAAGVANAVRLEPDVGDREAVLAFAPRVEIQPAIIPEQGIARP